MFIKGPLLNKSSICSSQSAFYFWPGVSRPRGRCRGPPERERIGQRILDSNSPYRIVNGVGMSYNFDTAFFFLFFFFNHIQFCGDVYNFEF